LRKFGATASVDLETDDLIQKTIRKEFADYTMLTVAHRINTIMDSTCIGVLSKGKLEEINSLANLLKNSSSAFSSLVQKAGLS
jgi:ABC-type multidrug transport system fused ATPase/permease subunit